MTVAADGSRRALLRPIAGTRPRGATPEEDARLAAELIADPKERAEHVMLVDLARNDLGRVCRPGTVEVSEFATIERYSHVMHIVSTVVGELRPECAAFDALAATFPAGTLTGAPKVRAMEIIEELEPTRRGLYGGTVGYFGTGGEMDMAIAIRTALMREGRAYVQAGAGVVADSDPAAEEAEIPQQGGDGVGRDRRRARPSARPDREAAWALRRRQMTLRGGAIAAGRGADARRRWPGVARGGDGGAAANPRAGDRRRPAALVVGGRWVALAGAGATGRGARMAASSGGRAAGPDRRCGARGLWVGGRPWPGRPGAGRS